MQFHSSWFGINLHNHMFNYKYPMKLPHDGYIFQRINLNKLYSLPYNTRRHPSWNVSKNAQTQNSP